MHAITAAARATRDLPGTPFPGDPNRYPHRDGVVAYLARYARRLDADIRTGAASPPCRPTPAASPCGSRTGPPCRHRV